MRYRYVLVLLLPLLAQVQSFYRRSLYRITCLHRFSDTKISSHHIRAYPQSENTSRHYQHPYRTMNLFLSVIVSLRTLSWRTGCLAKYPLRRKLQKQRKYLFPPRQTYKLPKLPGELALCQYGQPVCGNAKAWHSDSLNINYSTESNDG